VKSVVFFSVLVCSGDYYGEFSAHACSEIGLEWFLFTLHHPGKALGFVSVLDFFGDFVSSNTGETGKPELKPFLTIFGTRMRAKTPIKQQVYTEHFESPQHQGCSFDLMR
jgi:hypothetical protein